MQYLKRALATSLTLGAVAVCLAGTASAATTPEVKALQAQVKSLRKDVTALKAQVASLKAGVADASQKADAAGTAAASAATNASAAVAKTNCLVNATPFSVWDNFIFLDRSTGKVFLGTGMSITQSGESVNGYLAAVDSSCVPSVFPRLAGTSMAMAYRMPH